MDNAVMQDNFGRQMLYVDPLFQIARQDNMIKNFNIAMSVILGIIDMLSTIIVFKRGNT